MTLLWRAGFLLMFLLLIWAGWQLYAQQQATLSRLEQDQKILTQQVGDLNDRLVAVARLQSQPVDLVAKVTDPSPEQAALMRQNIRQGLLLAQAALQDGRQEDADALLLTIQSLLQGQAQQLLSPAVVQGLAEAVQADRVQLGQTAQLRQTARLSMDRALMRIQQRLDQMAQRGPVLHAATMPNDAEPNLTMPDQQQDWLDRLAQVVSIQRVSPDQQISLTQRALLCREVSLTLGLARHAVRQQQPEQLRALLQEAAQQLSRLPDAEAVQTQQWLAQLLASPLPQALPLKSLTLLAEREPS